ncbi:GNAT family N-acetyltransferase [Planobispora longispora]|uniref:N-acetyltransferase n=1 Tax=Planobispora longispora TaxID=28887 RepID=A0A8J3W3Z6_9ACTN|nr:GNAT family N-acetyltransferase [Planobispora longispora]BFE85049.1 GNAT family N-acetyltransferase [Planobispora longispora]GIH75257.1 N-acetyltransferase [Planobispora longispora]
MIRYTGDMSTIEADQLRGFFVGWPTPPSAENHLAVLRGSHRAIVALDGSGRVVGFVNMISDGVLTAFIPWLEVLPEYQGQGIGDELMRRILKEAEDMYSVDLICDPPLQAYYERLGMSRLQGMGLRNRTALRG